MKEEVKQNEKAFLKKDGEAKAAVRQKLSAPMGGDSVAPPLISAPHLRPLLVFCGCPQAAAIRARQNKLSELGAALDTAIKE